MTLLITLIIKDNKKLSLSLRTRSKEFDTVLVKLR